MEIPGAESPDPRDGGHEGSISGRIGAHSRAGFSDGLQPEWREQEMKILFVSTNRLRTVMPPMPLGLASIIGQIDESRHEL